LDDAIETLEPAVEARRNDSDLLMQLGSYCLADRQVSRAISLFERGLAEDENNWKLHELRADAYLRVGKQAEAIADYESALKLQPDRSTILNNLAWVLATSPDDKLRDGKRALELATKACEVTDYKQAHILSTLAAAYAEAGQFNTAIDWSQKAVELGKDSPESEQLAKELESYRHDQPWRERQTIDEESDGDKPGDEPPKEPEAPPENPDEDAPEDSAARQ
jgi:Flp pilus assembly protein TadD